MKVSFCPNCRLSPSITINEIKCPKCGKYSVGNDLTETVTNWNNGVYETETKVKMVVEEVEKPEKEEKVAEKAPKTEKSAKKGSKKTKKE